MMKHKAKKRFHNNSVYSHGLDHREQSGNVPSYITHMCQSRLSYVENNPALNLKLKINIKNKSASRTIGTVIQLTFQPELIYQHVNYDDCTRSTNSSANEKKEK